MANLRTLKPARRGEVRNPNGKPKGTRNRSGVARRILQSVLSIEGLDPALIHPENKSLLDQLGITTKTEIEILVTVAQVVRALMGDTRAYLALMDSAYGSPKQQTETETKTTVIVVRRKIPLQWSDPDEVHAESEVA